MFKGAPSSTNFDDEIEEGEVRSSPTKDVDTSNISINVTKGTEIHIDDGIMIDRTESTEIHDLDESSVSNSDSQWHNSLRRGLLDNSYLPTPSKDDDEPKAKRPKISCFNCGGEHQLSSCPEPKDMRRIREASNEFKEKRRLNESSRYHNDSTPKKERESDFRPGRISSALRRALGIGPDDIPEWIYRMRRMGFIAGYPPGYLRQATERGEREDEMLKFHLVDDEHNANDSREEDRESPPPVLNDKKMYYFMGFNKTYNKLNDRERNFRIPPFTNFCNFHQEEVTKKYWAERQRKRDEKMREKKNRDKVLSELHGEGDLTIVVSEYPDDDDCVVIDRNPTAPEEPTEEVSGGNEPPVIPLEELLEPSEQDSNGSASVVSAAPTVTLGTPVLLRKGASGDSLHNSLPSLNAFSKGITPFQAQEEPTPHRGFLKRIFAKIKNVTSGK